MSNFRSDRLSNTVLKSFNNTYRNVLRDPNIPKMLSFNYAKVSRDLSFVDIYVSSLMDNNMENAILKLERVKGIFRKELSKAMKTRTVPEIRFHKDDMLNHAQKIDEILNKINDDKEKNN